MSLHRQAAKRDAAEPAIVSALEALGCVVWRVSGKGLPDLIVLRAGKKWLADVKGPKDKPTPAQKEAWENAATEACAVFILRTPEDAAAMLNNALQPWEPEGCVNQRPRSEESRKHLAKIVKSTEATLRARKGDAAKALKKPALTVYQHCSVDGCERGEFCGKVAASTGMGHALRPLRKNYTPPRSTPVDAAKEAEATFACTEYVGVPCSRHSGACNCAPCQTPGCIHKGPCQDAPTELRRSRFCLDPDKMNGAGDQFPGSDYD